MRYKTTKLLFILAILLPSISHAQGVGLPFQIPQPFLDLFHFGESIQQSVEQAPVVKNAIQSVSGGNVNTMGIITTIIEWGRTIADWVQNTLGVNLLDVAKAMLGFFIWMLQFIVKLVQQVLSLVH